MFPVSLRKKMLVKFRYLSGNMGIALRYIALKSVAKKIGDNVLINEGVFIYNPDNIVMGNNVSIHPMSYIDAKGGIIIGNDVSIAHGVTLMSANHIYKNIDIPIKEQGIESRPITIEDNVWIGAKATVLGNCTISEGTVVGAGAVVTKNSEKNSVIAGVPAKKILMRE